MLWAAAGEGAGAVLWVSAHERSLQGLSGPVELGLYQEANPNLSCGSRSLSTQLRHFLSQGPSETACHIDEDLSLDFL